MKLYNATELEALAPYEEHFHTAVFADWTRHPGKTGMETIHTIYTRVSGDTIRRNDNCSNCVLSLLKSAGALYFKSKEALTQKEEEPKKESKKK